MRDLLEMVAALRRPQLLVEAARAGLDDYCRTAHLPRILGEAGALPGPRAALEALLELESVLNEGCRARAADYRAARHVAVLIALMAEARSLRTFAAWPDQTKASGIDSFLRAT